MKIKAKLFLGIGILFAMIALLTSLSGIFINKLSKDTKNILVANYNSIDYARLMLIAVNNGLNYGEERKTFEENLQKQQQNITEVGEEDLTTKLTNDYNQSKLVSTDSNLLKVMHNDLTNIMLLNMQAIERKSLLAEKTADNATLWITLAGTLCFLVAFTLLINLPGNIANPIKELSESIQQIAAQNYSQRVHFENHNEFGELAASFNSMAKKLEEFKAGNLEKLMMEKKRIETLINNMPDPVIGLDENKYILFMNDNALKLAGLKKEEVIGKQVQDIAVKNDLIRSLIQELFIANSEAIKFAPIKIFANNKESYFEKEILAIMMTPTGEKLDKLVGNVILLHNVTPYKELELAKTNFIATVSHELKTPLSSIKMSVQLLENKQVGELNEEQLDLMESIKDDADRLLKISSELLNMTQVEAGSVQVAAYAVPPSEITAYAISSNKLAAEAKKIHLQVAIPADIPNALADKEKTAWVLNNLLSNAIRYSYENATVLVAVAKESDAFKFSVSDTGQGIAPQYIDKIFDRYYRIPGSQKEGTGLGLAICKEFIEAQGGSIVVSSDFGAGSTFSFTLPIDK